MTRLINFLLKLLVFGLLVGLVFHMWSCAPRPKYSTKPPVVKRGGPRFK